MAIFYAVSLSSPLLMALSWVFLIFSRASFSYSKFWSCFFKCLSSFSFSTILLISYLLSRFLLNLAISVLFFWILLYCSLSSFLSSATRSSYSAELTTFFFFFLSFSFSTISSILTASSLSCPFSLVCCSMSLLRLCVYRKLRVVLSAYFLFLLLCNLVAGFLLVFILGK